MCSDVLVSCSHLGFKPFTVEAVQFLGANFTHFVLMLMLKVSFKWLLFCD